MYHNGIQSKQEQMYVDIVQLVAEIAKEGFGIDVIHNPLFSGIFKQHLEKHHQKLVGFVLKYAPIEMPKQLEPQQVHIESQPVNETVQVSWPTAESKQSG